MTFKRLAMRGDRLSRSSLMGMITEAQGLELELGGVVMVANIQAMVGGYDKNWRILTEGGERVKRQGIVVDSAPAPLVTLRRGGWISVDNRNNLVIDQTRRTSCPGSFHHLGSQQPHIFNCFVTNGRMFA